MFRLLISLLNALNLNVNDLITIWSHTCDRIDWLPHSVELTRNFTGNRNTNSIITVAWKFTGIILYLIGSVCKTTESKTWPSEDTEHLTRIKCSWLCACAYQIGQIRTVVYIEITTTSPFD